MQWNIPAFDLLAETLSISHILKVTWFDFAHVNDGTAPENTQVRRFLHETLQHLNRTLGKQAIKHRLSLVFVENAIPGCDCG